MTPERHQRLAEIEEALNRDARQRMMRERFGPESYEAVCTPSLPDSGLFEGLGVSRPLSGTSPALFMDYAAEEEEWKAKLLRSEERLYGCVSAGWWLMQREKEIL